MSWKRAKAKRALIDIMPIITSEDSTFLCKEEGDKVYLRYTYEWRTIDKKDKDKYLNVFSEDELSPEMNVYLNDLLKKLKTKK